MYFISQTAAMALAIGGRRAMLLRSFTSFGEIAEKKKGSCYTHCYATLHTMAAGLLQRVVSHSSCVYNDIVSNR